MGERKQNRSISGCLNLSAQSLPLLHSADPEPECHTLTSRQISNLSILTLATLTASLGISLFPPFYPQVAESKGATASVYGFILGTNCLTTFIVTPIIGRNLNNVGPKFIFVAGMFSNGVCCFLAGFLDKMPAGVCFIGYSIAIRILHAVGNAGVICASFTYVAVDFNHCIAKVFSFTRLMMNIGQLIGPALGGAFFQMGGYVLPFVVLGSIQCVVALLSTLVLENYIAPRPKDDKDVSNQISIIGMMRIPGMWISFGAFLVSTLANGFISITLEPQILRQFGMDAFYMGLVFGIKDGANSLFSIVWGYLCDRKSFVKPCLIISSVTVCVSLALLGPLPYVPIERTLSLTLVALILIGIGVGGQQLGGVIDALHETIDGGYSDDAATHGCVAGMWSSIGGLGRFVARSGCGVMVDNIGFRWSSVVIMAFHAALALATFIFLAIKRNRCKLPTLYKSIPHSFSTAALYHSSEFHRSRTVSILA